MRTDVQISSLAPSGLVLDGVSDSSGSLILSVRSEAAEAECPLCATVSRKIHSRYIRHVADLPSAGRKVHLRLLTRRFKCEVSHCRRRIFAERFGEGASRFDVAGQLGWNTSSITWGWRSEAGRQPPSLSGLCCLSATIPCFGWSAGDRRCRPILCSSSALMTGHSGKTIGTGQSSAIWSGGGSLLCYPTGIRRLFRRGSRSTQGSRLCREIAAADTARQPPGHCQTPFRSLTAGI
jgi:hypothetical protein